MYIAITSKNQIKCNYAVLIIANERIFISFCSSYVLQKEYNILRNSSNAILNHI